MAIQWKNMNERSAAASLADLKACVPALADTIHTELRHAELSFYPGYDFYEVKDNGRPNAKPRYVLYRPHGLPEETVVVDGSTEVIARVNDLARINLTSLNVGDYVSFYFAIVSAAGGQIAVIEQINAPEPADDDTHAVFEKIRTIVPPRVTARRDDGTFRVEAALLYRDCIFQAGIDIEPSGALRIAEQQIVFFDDPGQKEEIDAGKISLPPIEYGKPAAARPSSPVPAETRSNRNLEWREPAKAELDSLLRAAAPVIAPMNLDMTRVKVRYISLPFYDEFRLYGIFPQDQPGALFGLAGAGKVAMLDGSNQAIYEVNAKAPIKLTAENVAAYAIFFFDFVRGRHGHFIIIERPEEVPWLPRATEADKAKVNAEIHPLICRGIGDDGRYALDAKVLFKDALFKTTIRVARDGTIELTEEEPIFEGLPVLTEEVVSEALGSQEKTKE